MNFHKNIINERFESIVIIPGNRLLDLKVRTLIMYNVSHQEQALCCEFSVLFIICPIDRLTILLKGLNFERLTGV